MILSLKENGLGKCMSIRKMLEGLVGMQRNAESESFDGVSVLPDW